MAKPVLRLYVRANCHLCDDMKNELRQLESQMDFGLEVHDIDAIDSMRGRYNELVPVLMWGQDVICYHRLDKGLLKNALQQG